MYLRYILCGLRLIVDGEIPGLSRCDGAMPYDVRIWLNKMPTGLESREQTHWYQGASLDIWRSIPAGDFHFVYNDGTEFLIEADGASIWCSWPPEATIASAAVHLRGPVLAMVLRLRDVVCLHASAIALGDYAIAISGACGAGKSTTAAGFANLGHLVLADDVTALSFEGDRFNVLPAYPMLKLWPDAAKALYGSARSLPRLIPSSGINNLWDKRYMDLERGRQFQESPLPLAAVYVLGRRDSAEDAPRIEALSAQDAIMTLTGDTYVNYALDQFMRAREFNTLAQLVSIIPVRLVTPHSNAARLADLCQTVIRDFAVINPYSHGDSRTNRLSLMSCIN